MEPLVASTPAAATASDAGVSPRPMRPQARRISLLRLLLLVMALGIVLFFEVRKERLIPEVIERLHAGLLILAGISMVLVLRINLVRARWQLALHLVFDLLWVSLLIYYTGGVASPAVVLLFALVLIANLELPGVAPFTMPAFAGLVLAGNAVVYVAGWHPFPEAFIRQIPGLVDNSRILGFLAIQVAALFLVDLLGQLLAVRLIEQRIFTGVLLDQLGEGVLAVDLQGAIVYANAEVSRLLGLSEPLQARQVKQVLSSLNDVLELIIDSTMSERSRIIQGRYLTMRAQDLIGRHGRRIGRTLLVADESRLRMLEDNARRAEHLAQLGEMAAGIAHEVRNPLTSLRGCAQELSDICHKFGHSDAAALARIMVDESDRLARIVSDFLALSRLRSPERQSLSIVPIFDELRELTRRRADLPIGISVDVMVDADCPDIQADPDQLRQVLSNLLNNAIDAVINTPTARVNVRARSAGAGNPLAAPAVEMTVTDNGCGIPPELHERIFTPFFSTKARGTGLGLSLVSRIVREHDGIIKLESIPLGGTVITILLPASSDSRIYARVLPPSPSSDARTWGSPKPG